MQNWSLIDWFSVLSFAIGLIVLIKDFIIPFYGLYFLPSKRFKLSGNWHSSWEPKAINQPQWIEEKVIISVNRWGTVAIKNFDNNDGYNYTCKGLAIRQDGHSYIYGSWHSNNDNKRGKFILMVFPTGIMIGNFLGPSNDEIMASGGWVLAKNNDSLEKAKHIFVYGHVAS